MAAAGRKNTPDFFDDDIDPVEAATEPPVKATKKKADKSKKSAEPQNHSTIVTQKQPPVEPSRKKIKKGYYFNESNVDRFDAIYFDLKRDKILKAEQSELMEAILEHGLADLESANSKILKKLKG